MDTFNLNYYLYNNPLLTENIADPKEKAVVDDLKDDMSNILKGLESSLDKANKESASKGQQPTNEGALLIASIAVALPAILGLISKIGKVAGAGINKLLGKVPSEKNAYNEWMTKLGHIADELHHLYLKPIQGIVGKFVKDKVKADKISNGIFHLIVASFLIASGVGAVKALQAKNVSLATLEGAMAAVKAGEIKAFITGLAS